jgi:hypothetical protein
VGKEHNEDEVVGSHKEMVCHIHRMMEVQVEGTLQILQPPHV